MHALIAFAILLGIVAFAFGNRTAQGLAAVALGGVVVLIIFGFGYLVFLAWCEVGTQDVAKIPEITPQLRRTCQEWQLHPNDAPRMCFAVLDEMRK
jgi:hypothetical protein